MWRKIVEGNRVKIKSKEIIKGCNTDSKNEEIKDRIVTDRSIERQTWHGDSGRECTRSQRHRPPAGTQTNTQTC